jgi:hypothetical protein
MKPRWPYILLSILTLAILLPGFYSDQWNAGNKAASRKKVTLGESSVMGRLALTREQGLCAGGGFLAFVYAPGDTAYSQPYQYQAYFDKKPFENYYLYMSTSGFQGFLYGLWDLATPFSPAINMAFFKFLNAFLLVLVLIFFILLFFHHFGWLPALMVIAGTASSFVLPYYGPDPYFTLWADFLPVLVVFFLLAREIKTGRFTLRKAFCLVSSAMLVKGLMSGFEFITPVFVMALIPVVFYSIQAGWGFKKFFSRAILISAPMLLAIAFTLVLLGAQISIYEHDVNAGPEYILKSWHKRTSGEVQSHEFDELIRTSLKAGLDEVLERQFKGKAMDFNHLTGRGYSALLKITFLELTAWVAFISSLLLVMMRYGRWQQERQAGTIALVVATLASIAAPLSWYIVFKGHAYIHTRLDLVAWHLPYFIFSMALTGHFLATLFSLLYRYLPFGARPVHRFRRSRK